MRRWSCCWRGLVGLVAVAASLGATVHADYGINGEPTKLWLSREKAQDLPAQSVVLVERYQDAKYCQVRTFGDNPAKGLVLIKSLAITKGPLPDAEEAFAQGLRGLGLRKYGEFRTGCVLAAGQAPRYAATYRGVLDGVNRVVKAVSELKAAVTQAEADLVEARKMAQNAQRVAAAPSMSRDSAAGKQVRAVNMVAAAEQKAADAALQVRAKHAALGNTVLQTASLVRTNWNAGHYDVAFALGEYLDSIVLEFQLVKDASAEPANNEPPPQVVRTLAEARRALNEAGQLADKAAALGQQKRLREASELARAALAVLATHRQANLLSDRLAERLREVDDKVAQAQAAVTQHDYAGAKKLLTEACALTLDAGPQQDLLQQVTAVLAEKDQRVREAAFCRTTGEYAKAYDTYVQYGLAAELQALLPEYAAAEEKRGNFLRAYELYKQGGGEADGARVRQQAEAQRAAYQKCGVLLAEGKHDEAVAVYRRYDDEEMVRQVTRQKAAVLEGQGQYEAALAVYREVNGAADVARVTALLAKRAEALTQAGAKERAGDYEGALELYSASGHTAGVKRVAMLRANQALTEHDPAAAADYAEIAGEVDQARQWREQAAASGPRPEAVDAPEKVFERCAPATVSIVTVGGPGGLVRLGSGFFVSAKGYLITNYHVIVGSKTVTVLDAEQKSVPAQIVAVERDRDLALLKVAGGPFPCLTPGTPAKLKQGAKVYAIGTPQELMFAHSFVDGMLSGKRDLGGVTCLQVTVPINGGNSGGPLLDVRGRVIGVNTLKYVGRGDVQGINFAVSIDEATALLKQIPE